MESVDWVYSVFNMNMALATEWAMWFFTYLTRKLQLLGVGVWNTFQVDSVLCYVLLMEIMHSLLIHTRCFFFQIHDNSTSTWEFLYIVFWNVLIELYNCPPLSLYPPPTPAWTEYNRMWWLGLFPSLLGNWTARSHKLYKHYRGQIQVNSYRETLINQSKTKWCWHWVDITIYSKKYRNKLGWAEPNSWLSFYEKIFKYLDLTCSSNEKDYP